MYNLGKDFDSVEAKDFTPFENPPPGGYVFEVVDAEQTMSRSGRPMLTIWLNIDGGPYNNAFGKYPKPYRQMLDGDSVPYFKAMLNHFSKSNPAAKMQKVIVAQSDGSKSFNASALVGLRVGGALREAEYVARDGEIKVGLEVAYLVAANDAAAIKPPALKRLDKGGAPARPGGSSRQAPPEYIPDDCPF